MKPAERISLLIFGLVLAMLPAGIVSHAQESAPAVQPDATVTANLSHVRIVRLSFAEGTVTMKRPDMAEWSSAPVNTPLQEGFQLATAEKSFAEVEFENASTARVGQLSQLDFDQLAATSSGAKLNRMTLEDGYGTFNVVPQQTEAFEVKALDATVTLTGTAVTRFRIDIDEGAVRVEVFKGAATVSTPHHQETLTPNMVAELRSGEEPAFNLSTGITKDAWDQWVNEREDEISVVRNSPQHPGGDTYYGWNDLSNYGAWSYFPGAGYGWTPGAPFGWSPYTMGQWCWYPGFGFTWISSEPWGWLPYHYGGWQLYPGWGWTWFPGAMGLWSPGNVAWWQGDGWIGWSPLGVGGGSAGNGTANCPHGQICGRIVVRPKIVQDGKPVKPSIIRTELGEGTAVARPDLEPSKTGRMPGAIAAQPAFTARSGEPAENSRGAAGARGEVGGIQFNPATRGYENTAQSKPAIAGGAAAPERTEGQAAPTSSGPANVRTGMAPEEPAPRSASNSGSPVSRGSHSQAPVYRPSTPSNSLGGSPSGWGQTGGHSSNAGASGGWGSVGSSHSSGASGGSFGGGHESGGGGASSGGGGHSSGGGGGGPHK